MTDCLRCSYWKLWLASWLAVGGALATSFECARAQITPDRTLGAERSSLVPNVTVGGAIGDAQGQEPVVLRINGGAQRGANLFHSFREFNVNDRQRVYFVNPARVQNILTRVTGGQVSNILGTLGVEGSANLFLLNPNGILFGPNASLDVGGSFVGTTANALRFGEQGVFSATNPEAPPLLTVNPSALLFNQLNPGTIENRGLLQVPNGQSLLLVGGDVRLENNSTQAPGGRVEVGGLTGTGTVGLNADHSKLQLQFPETGTRSDVSLNSSIVTVDADKGGDIAIHARNLEVLNRSLIGAGIAESEAGAIENQAGDIILNVADNLRVDRSYVLNSILDKATGKSGNLNITAGSLLVTGDSWLRTATLGTGKAGDVQINVRDRISLNGARVVSEVGQNAVGQSGEIRIATGALELTNGAVINSSTLNKGNAGNVVIQARDSVVIKGGIAPDGEILYSSVLNRVQQGAVGQSGEIRIDARSLELTGAARISAGTSGTGDAGNIILNVSDRFSSDGTGSSDGAGIFSQVFPDATGQGGEIRIATDTLKLTNASQVSSATFGTGNAGNVEINARNSVVIQSGGFLPDGRIALSGIFSTVEEKAVGRGGKISIDTGTLQLTGGSRITSTTYRDGNAGDVRIKARDSAIVQDGIFLDTSLSSLGGIFSRVEKGASGQGGEINIDTGTLKLFSNAALDTSTSGIGNAGNIIINARDQAVISLPEFNDNSVPFYVPGDIRSTVQPGAVGKGGDIYISTHFLQLSFGKLQTGTYGSGDAGNVIVDAPDRVSLNDSNVFSGVANQDAVGNGGDVRIFTGSLEVLNGTQIDVSTLGKGNAGNVVIVGTQTVTVSGREKKGYPSAIFSTNSDGPFKVGTGRGGDILINAPLLSVSDGALLDARTSNAQHGGDINLTLGTLQLLNGGQIITTSESSGSAGTININADRGVTIAGTDPTYFERLNQFEYLAPISPNSSLSVLSVATGAAGNIILNAPRLTLDNQGTINAESRAVDGGNITLNTDQLLLRRHSTISATAGLAQGAGNGGNITINAPLIVAVPEENSDITANAFTGSGGKIQITASGIFGTQFRDELTPESDITASSEFGVAGVVELNTPDSDLSQGLVNLPAELVDASRLIASGCGASARQGESKFIMTGPGGLPIRPQDAKISPYPTGTVRSIPSSGQPSETPLSSVSSSDRSTNSTTKPPTQIVEAQGWVINNKGLVVLTATAPTVTPHNPWIPSATCGG